MSIALGKYHTFDLTKAYANLDYWSFYPDRIDPHFFAAPNGAMVPLHNFGGPLLWTGPFMLWGRPGAAAVIVLISVLIVVNIYYLLRDLGITQAYAGLVTGLFAVGTPLYVYASMQFIEPIGALVVIYSVRTVLNPAPSAKRVALTSAGLGYLPWVHGRFIIFSALIGALLLLRVHYRTGRRAALSYVAAVVPVALLILALEVFNFAMYGSLSPAPGNANFGDGLLQIWPHTGFSSLLFDRQAGLLTHFPIFVLAVPGIFLVHPRRVVPAHLILAVTIVPYVFAVSTYKVWWAGYSPPARYLMVVTPLLAYYVAATLQRLHNWVVTALAALAALAAFVVSAVGDVLVVATFGDSGGPGVDPLLNYVGDLFHIGRFAYLLPSGRVPDSNFVGFPAWFLALAVLTTVVWTAGRAVPATRVPVRAVSELFAIRPRHRGTTRGTDQPSLATSGAPSPHADEARADRPGP